MKMIGTLLQLLTGVITGLISAGIIWLVLAIDDAELKAGKSPHSGFSPATPTWVPTNTRKP